MVRPSTRLAFAVLLGLAAGPALPGEPVRMPWREAGWTAEQAAAHLLSRFAHGARPGEVERVAADPEGWFEAQLAATLPEPVLAPRLARFRALDLPVEEYPRRYPNVGFLLQQAREAGVAAASLEAEALGEIDRSALRREVMAFAHERGYRGLYELLGELVAQKILRAVHAENQLREVMTDFWFNHFNVSLDDGQARPYLLAYERDAVRRHALGPFRELLGATARHPAMLFYLDNAQSTAEPGTATTLDGRHARGDTGRREDGGLNENYARELLELHTLGVEGGYSQEDVREVARAFTGWTAISPNGDPELRGARPASRAAQRAGGRVEDGFLFLAGAHDAEPKTVLGHALPPGRGVEDGEEVLDLLARHPATARHLAGKIAVRFVSDRPPAELVGRLATAWEASRGDVRRVLLALVADPAFWAPEARGAKIKSPFELAVSSVRAVGGQVSRPRELFEWMRRMGQQLYAYPAPTGFPDDSRQWVHAGSLLNRMSFALSLAAGRIDGVHLDVERLVGEREPESRSAALETLLGRLLPGRDLAAARDVLAPMVERRDLAERIAAAAPREERPGDEVLGPPPPRRARRNRGGEPSALEQVVGVILGSPEFQRR